MDFCLSGTILMHYELNNFKMKNPGEFIQAIKALPANATSVDLVWHNLKSAEIVEALASLPANLESLNLAGNCLGMIPNKELIPIFKALPSTLKFLSLLDNHLGNITGAELVNIIKELPNLNGLNLGSNQLHKRTGGELVNLCKNLPQKLISLGLANNQLKYKMIPELQEMFKSLPPTLIDLDLRWNELLSKPKLKLALDGLPRDVKPPTLGDDIEELDLELDLEELNSSAHPKEQELLAPVLPPNKSLDFFDQEKTLLSEKDEKKPAVNLQKNPLNRK